jgi:hypothetical protein
MYTLADFNEDKNFETIHDIWVAIMEMNVSKLKLLLKDDILYEDIGKQLFIEKLERKFYKHRDSGDNQLYLNLDKCNGCKSKETVCTFTGNQSGKSFALYFEIEEQEIIDIFHCTWYGGLTFEDFLKV